MPNTVGKYAGAGISAAAFIGAGVALVAVGTHAQVGASLVADTLDIVKVPGNARVFRTTILVDGVVTLPAKITAGTAASATLLTSATGPVQLNSPEDVVIRLTSVGAADFPAGATITAIVEYLHEPRRL